jgi:hypothetical protein
MHFQRLLLLVALVALPGSVLFTWISPALDYEFFCAGENSCFREWVSALGGYIAIAAAALTLAEMARQRRLQMEIQRENVELQIGTQITIAKSAMSRVRIASLLTPLIHQTGAWSIDHSDWLMDNRVESLFRILKAIHEKLSHPDMKEFERFGGGLYSLEILLDNLTRADDDFRTFRARIEDGQSDVFALFETAGVSLAYNASSVSKQAEEYLVDVSARASAFVDRWEVRVLKASTE